MSKVFFISDAHLGAGNRNEEDRKEQKLISFFQHVKQYGSRLFIVGDFFDFWFEYKHAIPKYYFNILRALADLSEANIEIDFIVGNHDYWVDNFFTSSLGIRIHKRPLTITIQSKKLYIAHGHGLLSQKRRDRVLKKIIEHPINIFIYRLISPDIGIPMAQKFSHLSRKYGANDMNPDDAKGRYVEFGRQKLNAGFDAVVLGHTHTARIINYHSKYYLNLGDWMKLFSYGVLENSQFSLKYW